MNNPWLEIPAADYEGHMQLSSVRQLQFLAKTFQDSLNKYDPSSIAYLGCATGNGLDSVTNEKTQRVTAFDINPEYLSIVRQRYQHKIKGLSTIQADLTQYNDHDQHYTLVFAGLSFEYLDPASLLPKIAQWLTKDGVLVVVLQLDSSHVKKISATPFTSLNRLDSIMHLLTPNDFKQLAHTSGLKEFDYQQVVLESGKPFYIGAFKLCKS